LEEEACLIQKLKFLDPIQVKTLQERGVESGQRARAPAVFLHHPQLGWIDFVFVQESETPALGSLGGARDGTIFPK
jgi:hypothetical protein